MKYLFMVGDGWFSEDEETKIWVVLKHTSIC